MTIRSGSVVEIRYRLFDASGQLVETTDDQDAISYRHGREEILPGLERALEGAAPGERIRVTLPPEEAYGPHNPEGIVSVPRSELPEGDYAPGTWVAVGFEPEPGEEVLTEPSEDDEGELELRVVEVHEDVIVMDANHPLAGQSATFEIEVVSVQP